MIWVGMKTFEQRGKERRERREAWQKWFAWYPVVISRDGGRYNRAWFSYIYRRYRLVCGFDEYRWVKEYSRNREIKS